MEAEHHGVPLASTDYRLLKGGGVFSMRLRREAVSLGLFLSPILISCVYELQVPGCGLPS